MTVNSLVASDYVVIPLQCEYYALEGLGQLIKTYQLVHKNLNPNLEIGAVILTMADFRTNLTQQVIEEVRNYFKDKVFEAIVPRSVKLSEAPSFGIPAVFYDPHSKGARSYKEVAIEFIMKFPVTQEKQEKHTEKLASHREEILKETSKKKDDPSETVTEDDRSKDEQTAKLIQGESA